LDGKPYHPPVADPASEDLRDAYLTLLKHSLLGTTMAPAALYRPLSSGKSKARDFVVRALRERGRAVLAAREVVDPAGDPEGRRFVTEMFPGVMTMIGERRLDNIDDCVRDVIDNGVEGDLIETGVWRGGSTILMRGILRAYGITDRTVYVADSFEGLPPPDTERYPADAGLDLHVFPELAVSLEDVRANFARFGLLDEQVVFVKGWFRDSLPALRDHRWAVVRLDGDLYESTMDALENLYPGLSPGGWLIVDDYYDIDACAQAVIDYRQRNGIRDPIRKVDWSAVCWKKSA
jgi:O-methyltransferase